MKSNCLYEKLEKTSKNFKNRENLFQEFSKPVNETKQVNYKEFSINEIICKSVDNAIEKIVNNIIDSKSIFKSSKNVKEVAKNCEQFFQDSKFGTFEYDQRAGRSSFKVKHQSGNNGTRFLIKFFEKIFNMYLKKYSFHIISDNTYVCILFR